MNNQRQRRQESGNGEIQPVPEGATHYRRNSHGRKFFYRADEEGTVWCWDIGPWFVSMSYKTLEELSPLQSNKKAE